MNNVRDFAEQLALQKGKDVEAVVFRLKEEYGISPALQNCSFRESRRERRKAERERRKKK